MVAPRSTSTTGGADGDRESIRVKSGYHHGSLRRALIDAALVLVAEKGPRGFTLSEAARLAGVSVAAPYRHFDGKEGLLAAVAEGGFDRLRNELESVAASHPDDPVERLLALGVAYVGFAVRHDAEFTVMFSLDSRTPTPERGRRALQALTRCIAELAQVGMLRTDVETATRATWALAHGVAVLQAGRMNTFAGTSTAAQITDVLSPLVEGGILTGDGGERGH